MNNHCLILTLLVAMLCGGTPCTAVADTLDIEFESIEFPEGEWITKLASTECGNILALGNRVVYSISLDSKQLDTVLESTYHDWLQNYMYESEYTNEIFVVDGNKIMVTNDCGQSWIPLHVPRDEDFGTRNIEIDANGRLYLARVSIGLYMSDDRVNWDISCTNNFHVARDMAVGKDGTVFLGSDAALTIKFSDGYCRVVERPGMNVCKGITKATYIDIISDSNVLVYFDGEFGMESSDGGESWECFDLDYMLKYAKRSKTGLKLGVVGNLGSGIRVFASKSGVRNSVLISSYAMPHLASDVAFDSYGYMWVCGRNDDNSKLLTRSVYPVESIVDIREENTRTKTEFSFFSGDHLVVPDSQQNAATIEIVDLLGRRWKYSVEHGVSRIPISELEPGGYIVVFYNRRNTLIGVEKLLKE